MPTVTAFATVKNGALTLNYRSRFVEDCRSLADGDYELTIKKRDRRSTPQNRYLWGVVYKEIEIRLRELGNTVDSLAVHEFCKLNFNPEYILGAGGEAIGTRGASSSELNKEQFGNYIDQITQWAAEKLEIYIPAPNEVLKFNF